MQEFNRGILHTLRELYSADATHLPRKTVAGLLTEILKDEADAEDAANAGLQLLLEQTGREPGTATDTPQPDAVRQYARELLEAEPETGGITLIRMIMEHFSLTQSSMARLLGINQGWLSSYLREGKRSNAVLAALTTLCGD